MIEISGKIKRSVLINQLEIFLLEAGFAIKAKKNESDPVEYTIYDGVRKFFLNIILKTVSFGGWKDHPEIKRIQIGSIKDNIVYTTKNMTFMLCGLIQCNGKTLMVVWNAYEFTKHNTNRSCYVTDEAIEEASKRGYVRYNDFDCEKWICDAQHFGILIRDYISFNYMEK